MTEVDAPDVAKQPRQQTLASRRSRPELDLGKTLPPPSMEKNRIDETPLETPSLEESLHSSPEDGTPSPAHSADTPERLLSSEDPPSPIAPLMPKLRRPSYSRSRSAFDAVMADRQKEPGLWQPPPMSRVALAAREMSMPRRSSDGSPLFAAAAAAASSETRSHLSKASSTSNFAFSMMDNGHSRHRTSSSTMASSGPLTPSDEEVVSAAVRFSWGPLATQNDARRLSEAMQSYEIEHGPSRSKPRLGNDSAGAEKSHNVSGGMGLMGAAHFGPGVRTKVSQVLEGLLADVPLCGEEDEVIAMCEYGALNSRSTSIMTEMVSRLAQRHHDTFGDRSNASFYVTHADAPHADFRAVSSDLDSSDAYSSSVWQMNHEPPLVDRAFPAFVGRPRQVQVLPAKSVSAGISLFDLHWGKVGQQLSVADQELGGFLRARAAEFRSGGLLVMAFMQRSDETDGRPTSFSGETDFRGRASRANSTDPAPIIVSPPAVPETCEPLLVSATTESTGRCRSDSLPPARPSLSAEPRRDLWKALTRVLAPCIQRLVSCGMIKSDIARHMLALPDRFCPRTPRQTAAVLQAHESDWIIEYSAGLAEVLDFPSPSTPRPPSPDHSAAPQKIHEDALRLLHPACKALQAGLMGPKVYAEHAIQLVKTVYEHHFRTILMKRGKLARSATEWVCDSLFDILREKLEEGLLGTLEIEVTLVALRRT